jgi:PAS domain S-box-containing protein
MIDHDKRITNKIIFLVGIQIAIITTSFLIVEVTVSKQTFEGNSINIAGKNRFFTEMVLNAVKDHYIGGKLAGDPILALKIYEQNLQILKTGGTQMGMTLSPLPKEFNEQSENIHNLYLDYQGAIQSFVKSDSANYRETKLVEISSLADKLVEQNNILTVNLASDIQTSSNEQIWLLVSLGMINIGTIIFMKRLIYKNLKKKAQQLAKIEKENAVDKKYRSLYDGLPDLCRTVDEDGVITNCNVSYANNLGYSKEEIIGKSIFDFVDKSHFDVMHNIFETWKRTGSLVNHELWLKRKDGSIFPTLISTTSVCDENGKRLGANSVIVDMSQIYETRKMLIEKEKQLAISEEKAKNSRLIAIGETASRLGHDLRNPLSVITNTIGILKLKSKNDVYDENIQEKYAKIERAISRMSHQIEDVLDFVRIKPLELANRSLVEIINEVSDKITKPDNVKINLPQNDLKITCDSKKLEIAFVNLITNAIQAIGDKGEITIKMTDDKDNACISIEDSGPGIPDEILSKIFDPLFTTKQTGTGLGLVSCKNIIEQHGGSITVTNKPTTFTILLPLAQDDPKVKIHPYISDVSYGV